MKFRLLACLLSLVIIGCKSTPPEAIRLAINPWPGYEFLFLAEQQDLFKKHDLNIELLQLSSLSDTQRAYISGRADGMASTLIEVVQAPILGGKPLKVVLITDFSNGGDVIISNKDLASISDLKGKTIGTEVSSLGIYVLQRALAKHQLTLHDVNIINTEQLQGEQKLLDSEIDAFVSYPPVSIDLLKHPQFHQIFDSSMIPREIIDTVSFSQETLSRHPDLPKKLLDAWQDAVDYALAHPKTAHQIMAKRIGISEQEFEATLDDLIILDKTSQLEMFKDSRNLEASALAVCNTLVFAKSIEFDCANLQSRFISPAI